MKTTLFLLIAPLYLLAQAQFEYTEPTLTDEIPLSVVEKQNGDYSILTSQFYDTPLKTELKIMEFSAEGEMLATYQIANNDTLVYFPSYFALNNNGLDIFGKAQNIYNDKFYFWYLRLDENMDKIREQIYLELFDAELMLIMDVKKTSDNKVAIVGIKDPPTTAEEFIVLLDSDFEVINYKLFPPYEVNWPDAVMEKADKSGFFIKSVGSQTAVVNPDFTVDTIISFTDNPLSIPQEAFIGNPSDIRQFTDNTYLVAGTLKEEYEKDIAIKKVNESNEVESFFSVGSIDTVQYSGIGVCLDFNPQNEIFLGGWQANSLEGVRGLFDPYHSHTANWLILSKLDEDLNPLWTRYYGGDACYTMIGVLATSDGGCLMYGGKYDFTGIAERDIHLLKVGPDGLLTSTTAPELGRVITVYPNPSSHFVCFDTGEAGEYALLIFDSAGRQIMSSNIENNRPVDVRHLPTGTYTYVLTHHTDEFIAQGKWVKQE